MTSPATSPAEKSAQSNPASRIGFWLGMIAFASILLFTDLDPEHPEISRMAAVVALMAIWWMTEAIPLAATALIPLATFPLLGIMKGKDAASAYVSSTIFLFIGGFMIALAMERWNLHKRIALGIIRAIGGGPNRLVLSFMLATAFLSMWISNTATSIMMLAIGLAIISQTETTFGKERCRNLTVALLLGIAYSASIGGMATLVGTPTNLAFVSVFANQFPQAEPVSFGQWMLLGVPLSLVMLFFSWITLTRFLFPSPPELCLSPDVIRDEARSLGRISFAETSVLIAFTLTALLWVFRKDISIGDSFQIYGWSRLVPSIAPFIDDSTVVLVMALSLFLIPSRSSQNHASLRILDSTVFSKLPWDIILLLGGGFALAAGFQAAGLSTFIGQKVEGFAGSIPPIGLIAIIGATLTFLTELTSNVATTQTLLPILASIAVAIKTNPLLLMIPATLSASCAFMMPVATPPNAIVFGSGRIRITDMIKAGIVLNLIGIIVITLLFFALGTKVFQIDPKVTPEWASKTENKH
ncbi:MAG: SLC13 family permease [Verrucomicrobiales bacterium]|nr:SLC13 family permease [Verrucomicrobiales bacterium]